MLGDTTLVARVEKDYAVYGDECKFGGGKTQREGMGQVRVARNAWCCAPWCFAACEPWSFQTVHIPPM